MWDSLQPLQFLLFTNFHLFLLILASSKGSYLHCSRTLVMVSFQSQESLEELIVCKGFRDEQHVANIEFQMWSFSK